MLSPDMVFSSYQYELTMDLLDAEFPGGLRLNEDDVAAVLSNLQAESGISPASPQVDNYGKVINVGGSPEEYITNVNNGTYSKEQFASDGVGFGLASWTYPDLKENYMNMQNNMQIIPVSHLKLMTIPCKRIF